MDPGKKEFGVIKYAHAPSPDASLNRIRTFLKSTIQTHGVTMVFREGYAYHYQNPGITKVVEVGGVMKELFFELGVPYLDVAPKTVKKIITGNGSATKQDVIKVVNKLYNLNETDDNIADAIALYTIGLAYRNHMESAQFQFGQKKVADCSKQLMEHIDGMFGLSESVS